MTFPSDSELRGIPAPIRHAWKVWNLLLENSNVETIKIPLSDETIEATVFRGSIGDVFSSAGVSKTYYSPVRKILVDCRAITILEKGNIHSPSIVVLDRDSPPPLELPPNVKSSDDDLTDGERVATLSHTVEVLETRLGGINLVEALKNIERRLSQLEGKTGDRRENVEN